MSEFSPALCFSFPWLFWNSVLLCDQCLTVRSTDSDCTRSDYDVFLSPLSDFQTEMANAGLDHKAVYLDRGDEFRFEVKQPA